MFSTPFEEEIKTPEILSGPIRFLATEVDGGDVVAMEIRPSAEATALGAALVNALAALDAYVDKTPAPFAVPITNADEYKDAWAQLRKDRIEEKKVEETLKPFSDLAFKVHRTITGKTNFYRGFAQARIAVYDPAIVEYDRREEDARAAEAKRIREAAEREDEERRKQEAKELAKRGETERAKEVLAEKPRAFHVSVPSSTPKIGGGSIRKRYVAHVDDEEQLIRAIPRPDIYREIAAWLKVSPFAKAKTRKITMEIVNAIIAKANTFPVIPFNAVEASESTCTKVANATNGKLDWPGVSVEEDRKTSTRTK